MFGVGGLCLIALGEGGYRMNLGWVAREGGMGMLGDLSGGLCAEGSVRPLCWIGLYAYPGLWNAYQTFC
jgi:hypothetical protein